MPYVAGTDARALTLRERTAQALPQSRDKAAIGARDLL